MRKIIAVIICLIIASGFAACNNTKKIQEETISKDTITLSKEEKELCISALNRYLEFDELTAEKAEKTANYIESNILNKNSGSDNNKDSYRKNIDSTTVIAKQAIDLLNNNRLNEAVKLLDSNINKFHSHPANTIATENELHVALYILYQACYSEKEASTKAIELEKFTKLHFQLLEELRGEMNPGYPAFLADFAFLHYQAKDYSGSMNILQELLPLIEKSSGEKSEAYTIVIKKLIDCSEKAGLSNQAKKYKEELKRIEKL